MSLSAKKAEIVRSIESNIVRGDIVEGFYGWASFKYGNNEFKVIADYSINNGKTESAILKNGRIIRGSIVSNGRYRSVCLYGRDSLMEHQLLAVALIPGATEALLDETVVNVINHMTISSESLEAKEARYNDIKYWSECVFGGCSNEYDRTKYQCKAYQPPCCVRDLEICTSSENYAHGAFIRTFGLYDYRISATDIPLLKQLIIDRKRAISIVEDYMKFGAETLTRKYVG